MLNHTFVHKAHDKGIRNGCGQPGDHPNLLTAKEEIELSSAIKSRDQEALSRMVTSNQGLVTVIAKSFLGRGLPLEDLVGEGNLGLIRAAHDFDPRFGVRFSTYASHWIRQSIREALIKTAKPIRLPYHMFRMVSEWRRIRREMEGESSRPPSFDQIARHMQLTDSQKTMLRRALRVFQFEPQGSDELNFLDRVIDQQAILEDRLELEDKTRLLELILERLDEKHSRTLSMRFGLAGHSPMTYRELGRVLGCTREWARKRVSAALRMLTLELHCSGMWG